MVYAKAAKTEQIMLQKRAKMQWMKDGDQCSRVFFRKIAQRRAIRRILQINDEHGTTHTDPGEVVHEFVSYYQNLLGGNRRRTLVDSNYLRPWARHILSDEEASHLLAPFSPEEVKLAVFDIAEDKAPGPDGYSSGFYKAAWPVVGAEVTRAVLDFFSTGRLLKQVNSTVLALIPKVHTPMSAAFIPGRSIGDNIMLAQELFMGYNQARLPPRCALKVDIRKASDTVEWDFLVATLQLFGFPPTFTRFFTGARGLRQGDPLSPFLFVLVMEDMQFKYHWKSEPARVFQLGFADDLLLFCRADLDSVRVLKVGLDRFAEWSGLRKERSVAIDLGILGGTSPDEPLLSKIDARIAGWEGMSLSYAGRQWASAFILPKAIIKEVEKRLRRFLWKGTSMTGYAKVAWKDVCKPVREGGQGIKDIDALNRALMTKKLCDIIRCDRTSIWVEWLQRGRLQNNSIWTIDEKGGLWGWRKLLRLRSLIQPMVECRIGDGRTFYLWKDPWHHLGPLIYRFPRGPCLLGLDESTKLNTVIDEGQWHWPLITDLECLQIIYTLPQIHDGDDRIIWRFPDGRPTAQALYRLICPPGPKVGWTSLLSGSLKIPRHCFILWKAIQEKLPTTDKPWLTHIGGCILCDEEAIETHNHLFFRCRFSRRCLKAIREIIRFAWPNRTWAMDVEWAVRKWRGKHIINAAYRALLGSFVYHLWRERNSRRFQQIEHPPNVLASLIIDDVRQRILSLNLSSSISTCALYRLWRILWPVEGIPN
ncbi:UNVERIFIED_CONTAM: Retrovirus-related Pol polyprotein from type-1 retrotransposable element R2 [Sesamum indicum]